MMRFLFHQKKMPARLFGKCQKNPGTTRGEKGHENDAFKFGVIQSQQVIMKPPILLLDNEYSITSLQQNLEPHVEFFKLAHNNAQSLASHDHFNDCKKLLANNVLDVLAVFETLLTEKDSLQSCFIDGYQCFRNDRLGKRGSGVCLYVKFNRQAKLLNKSLGEFSNNPAYIILEIIKAGRKLLCAAVYRRPNGSFSDIFLRELGTLVVHYEHCFIDGDLNIDFNCNSRSKIELTASLADINLKHIPISITLT
jgi:hypothetical protein